MGAKPAICSNCQMVYNIQIGIEQQIKAVDKKVGIFKISQYREVNNNAY
jgi:hypothetical protein